MMGMTVTRSTSLTSLLLSISFLLVSSPATARMFDTQEELDAHNAICTPLQMNFRAENNAMKPSIEGMKSARKALRKSKQAYMSAYNQYVGFRNAGDNGGAKAAAMEVDKHWADAASYQKKAIHFLDEGVEGRSEGGILCRAWYAWRDAQCVKPKLAASSCASVTYLSKWKANYKRPDIADKKYANTWRQPQDYIFDEPSVAVAPPSKENPSTNSSVAESYAGFVRFIHGRAFIERGIKALPAKVGSILHVGDKVNVEEGSQAEIELMGAGRIKITELTSFQIRETVTTPEKRSIFQKALQQFNKTLAPEDGSNLRPDSFNKKTGDGGRRG